MSRLIDADKLLKGKDDHETISTHLVWNAPTVDVVTWKDFIDFMDDNAEDLENLSDRVRILEGWRLKVMSMPSDSIEALARIVALQGKRIDALEQDAIPIKWLKEQAEDTPYQHRVNRLIERWKKEK